MHSLPVIDIVVLVGYLTVVVGWGCWFARKNNTADQFMSAGRGLPGWVVGLSIFGSFVSSISFLALPGKAFAKDWNAFVFSLSLPVAALAAAIWFVPFYRRSGELSAYNHFEHRFGPWARTYGVVCYMLTQLGRLGVILYLLAVALQPLVGMEIATIIIISGCVVTVYPFFGGSEGVIWTGAVQAVVLVLGVVVCLILPVLGVPEGPSQVIEMAAKENRFSLGDFGGSLSQPTFWVILVYGLAANLQNFGIDQSYVQRYITAKDDRAATSSVWMGALSYVPLSAALLFIGTALWAFYKIHPTALSPELAEAVAKGQKTDLVFPYFISTQLPAGLMGLVLAAICSAAMDSNLNCCATLYLCDIHRRYIRPNASEAESMWVLRITVLVMGALSTMTGLAIIGVTSALDVWWAIASILGGGTLGLFLLGLVVRRANGKAAAVATALNIVVILWMAISLTPQLKWLLPQDVLYKGDKNLPIVIGTLVLLLSGLLLSFFAPFRRSTTSSSEPLVAAAPVPSLAD